VSEPDRRWSPEVRAQGAQLLHRFRAGGITQDEFEDAFYPLIHHTKDRALCAIATAVWATYSDLKEHTLEPQPGDVNALFDRCILFLRSDRPYRWERDNFISIWGFRWISRTISKAVKRMLGRTAERSGLRPGPDSFEDWSVWPFESAADMKRVLVETSGYR
jgi:hypothetical protein